MLKSGRHASSYIDLDPVFSNSHVMEILGWRIANSYRFDYPVHYVIAPATGGIALAVYTSLGFSQPNMMNRPGAIWADKSGDSFVLGRGFAKAVAGRRVLAVEDMLTTGTSLGQVIALSKDAGGIIMGAASVCNRGNVTARDLGVPHLASLTLGKDFGVDLTTFDPADCPMCGAL